MAYGNGNLHRNLLALLIAGCGEASTAWVGLLAYQEKEIPPSLVGVMGAAFGALATAFTRFPPPSPTEVKEIISATEEANGRKDHRTRI